MKKKKIALLQNDACYGYLMFCMEQIASVLERNGYQTEYFSCIDERFFHTEWAAAIGINEVNLSKKLENGDFLFDYLGCPIFEIIVDSPYHHDAILREHPNHMHLICLDEGHAEYSKKYYGPFQSVEMGYLLGDMREGLPYQERQIGVLFSGSKINRRVEESIKEYPLPWLAGLFNFLIEAGKKYPNLSTDKLVLVYFERLNLSISKADYETAMHIGGALAEFYLRGYYREKIIETLLEAGISVTVLGAGWEEFQKRYPELFQWKGCVSYTETLSYIGNAKILLNAMPWFKDGLHDRIPASMHSGAVCVTDSSSYIDRHFNDGEDIVLYDLFRLDQLPGKILYLLEHDEIAAEIAKKGHEKAIREYTWKNMVENNILKYL